MFRVKFFSCFLQPIFFIMMLIFGRLVIDAVNWQKQALGGLAGRTGGEHCFLCAEVKGSRGVERERPADAGRRVRGLQRCRPSGSLSLNASSIPSP